MAVVYSKVLLFDPPLIYTAPDICVFGAVIGLGVKTTKKGNGKRMDQIRLKFCLLIYMYDKSVALYCMSARDLCDMIVYPNLDILALYLVS